MTKIIVNSENYMDEARRIAEDLKAAGHQDITIWDTGNEAEVSYTWTSNSYDSDTWYPERSAWGWELNSEEEAMHALKADLLPDLEDTVRNYEASVAGIRSLLSGNGKAELCENGRYLCHSEGVEPFGIYPETGLCTARGRMDIPVADVSPTDPQLRAALEAALQQEGEFLHKWERNLELVRSCIEDGCSITWVEAGHATAKPKAERWDGKDYRLTFWVPGGGIDTLRSHLPGDGKDERRMRSAHLRTSELIGCSNWG